MRFLDVDEKRERFAKGVQALVAIRDAKDGRQPSAAPSKDEILRIADAAREAAQERRVRPRYVMDNRPKGLLERAGDAIDDGLDRLFGFK